MRILALETAELTGSVAALEGDRLLAEMPLPADQRSAQSLAPAIQGLLTKVGWQPVDVELMAVTSGPGSFTSLRIGVTTAKAFAYAAGCRILGVDTLEVIAERLRPDITRVRVVMDAQRQQVFAGTFARTSAGSWDWEAPLAIEDDDVWLAGLAAGDVVSGPVLKKLGPRLPSGVTAVEPELWSPTAAATGLVAWRHYQLGKRDDVFSLVPLYFRRTAAEEQYDKRAKA